ncbi:translation initiation factor IF-2 subunit beta [Candidatus Pacearchaeota archaeon]|nr:translation initiation factor IF-2 subunit beta [Candidatus Pacearchaeota archaeon]
MESYEVLLEKAYGKIKIVGGTGERFEIPKVAGIISGKSTIITNITTIANYLRRPVEHLAKFLQRSLATPGKLDGERLILNTKLNSQKVIEKIQIYSKEFVLCNECGKPDTEIISDKGIKSKHCLACGAKSSIKQKI